MKKRKQIDSELDEIRQDVAFLKNKMELLCQWITKKFGDLDFEKDLQNSRQLLSQPNTHNHNHFSSSSIENEPLVITKNSKPQEHSYSSISVTTPNPNLYDMVDEELSNNSGEDMFISPPANPSILDTPKKSKPPLITKQVIKSTNAYAPHPPPSVPLVHNSNYAFTTPPSSAVSNDEQIGQNVRQPSLVINKEPKKKRVRAKRVRSPKKTSQSASSTTNQLSSDDENPTLTSKTQTQIIQCEICGKLINGPAAMKRHSQTHTNVRAHKCSDCGKSFQRKFHLKTHRLIHDGEKKHQCRFCGKLFLLPKDIVAHERTHTGEKPYACENCPRKFTLKSHLVMHMRTHTGEKPYKCDSCDKCFTQANSLRVHKKAHLPQSSTNHQYEEKPNKIAIKKVQPPPTDTSGHNPASTSMITTMSEYSMRSSNNFNIIGQLIPISPISLPNQLNFTQLQSASILRIPTQLPVTVMSAGGSGQSSKEVNSSLEPNGNQLIHSLQDEESYYDLENL